MTGLDLTQFQNMTQEQYIAYAHNETAVPAILIVWILTMILFAAIGFLSTKNKGKFGWIWLATLISSGIIVLIVSFMPNAINAFSQWFSSFFSF